MGGGGRRWQLWLGIALIVVGLSLVGYVAWQLYGTNVVAHRHREQALGELHRSWDRGETVARTSRGTTRAQVRIPRFGRGYAVPVLDGTSSTVLATGFGHYRGSAGPGQVGNFALAGHRVTHGEPLRRMPDLRKGDLVYVDTARTTYTYRLLSAGDSLVVPFTAGWVLDPLPTNPDGGVQPPQEPGQRLLTLTTCSELFHTDNRMVAFGVLVDASPRK
jgi:sortase A